MKRTEFKKGDTGFWGVRYWIKWVDTKGKTRRTVTDGVIYLIVTDKKYISLHSVEGDPNFAWNFIDNGVEVKMTTGGRTYVERKNDGTK